MFLLLAWISVNNIGLGFGGKKWEGVLVRVEWLYIFICILDFIGKI